MQKHKHFMSTGYSERYIFSIGGSLIVPNGGINIKFLSNLNNFIRNQLAKHQDRQFFLTIGGGATARHYISRDDQDWLGVHATKLNAHLVRTIFRDIAHPYIIKHYEIIRRVSEPVIVAAGWKPGWSTDYCATLLCQDYNVKTVVNLSNIKQVYDKDPRKFSDAKPLDHMSWDQMRTLVGDEWVPGMHAPFDPVAAKKAQELSVKVVVMSGENFENVENYLEEKKFVGTVIE